ncbi:MAG: response regulator transcription factor [Muribaculaceae bacterium]|jgi:DNA-binding response OmpR family regulator|nr:response regulator transcription factor [Muribaculaceae bacterium]
MRILIIEDEKSISDGVLKYLVNQNYLCDQAFSCREALMKSSSNEYDCILLDLMLPDGDGLNLLKIIKMNSPSAGIIILSAKGTVEDKVEGMKLGADDYLPKPFNLAELNARVFALLRRRHFKGYNRVESNNVQIDLLSKSVSVGGSPVILTKSEFSILLFLIHNKGSVITKIALAEHLCGEMADMMNNFNFVYCHIKNLKSKLLSAGGKDCIKTIYGVGYKWEEQNL